MMDATRTKEKTMTPDGIRYGIDTIAQTVACGDDEAAHAAEDDLYADVLRAIAGGAPNAVELAREALRTKDIDFARWCA